MFTITRENGDILKEVDNSEEFQELIVKLTEVVRTGEPIKIIFKTTQGGKDDIIHLNSPGGIAKCLAKIMEAKDYSSLNRYSALAAFGKAFLSTEQNNTDRIVRKSNCEIYLKN